MSVDSTCLMAAVLVARPRAHSGHVGDAQADSERRRQTQLMRDFVARFRGHLERASSDSALAVFDSVSAAAGAAISLHRQFAAQGSALSTCIGAGEIQISQLGCAGNIIQQALDACSDADPDTCLITEQAASLLGSRMNLNFDASSRVPTIDWHPRRSMAAALGVPPPVQVHDKTPVIGRDKELGLLAAALDRAQAGQPGWISMTGEAGMGKTRLVSEFATQAHAAGALVLCGVASEDFSKPFSPIVQALKFWYEAVDEPAFHLGPKAGELARLLPDLRATIPDLPAAHQADPESERQALFGAVRHWLTDLTRFEPVVLILDSLHWETDSTFELLHSLLAELVNQKLLVVVTQRPGHAMAENLARSATKKLGTDAAPQIQVSGLNAVQIEQFFKSGGRAVDSGIAQSLFAVTGGLPLHLAEMVHRPDAGADAVERSVQQVLSERIAGLDSATRQVVETAAVVGEVFDLRDLTDVVDDADGAIDALDGAVEDGLFHLLDARNLRYRFVHSLTRDAAYAAIRPARLARLHERVGMALEKRGPATHEDNLANLSRHFRNAISLGHQERAVQYTLRAADRALSQFANDVALRLYDEALDIHASSDDQSVRAQLMIGQGRAQRRLGRPDYRQVLKQAADLAHTIGDGELMARATFAAYRGSYTRALHVDEDAVHRLRLALELLTEPVSVERARLLSLLAVELTWAEDRTQAMTTSTEAVAVARQLDDQAVLTEVLAHDQWVCFHPTEGRLQVAAELAQLAPLHSDPRLRFEIASHDIFTATRIGDRRRLDLAIAQARELAELVDQPAERSMLLLREATVALMEARHGDVNRLIQQRRELAGNIGEADGEAAYRIHQFWLSFDTLPAAAGRQLVQMVGSELPPAQKYLTWPTLLVYACDVGELSMAKTVLDKLLEDGLAAVPKDQMWLWNMSHIAAAVCALQRSDQADELIELLEPQRARHSNMVFNTLGSTARYLGLLHALKGAEEQAEVCLREAVTGNRAINAPAWMARTQLDLAQLLGGLGRDGSQYVAAGLQAAVDLRLPLVVERARQLESGLKS